MYRNEKVRRKAGKAGKGAKTVMLIKQFDRQAIEAPAAPPGARPPERAPPTGRGCPCTAASTTSTRS